MWHHRRRQPGGSVLVFDSIFYMQDVIFIKKFTKLYIAASKEYLRLQIIFMAGTNPKS